MAGKGTISTKPIEALEMQVGQDSTLSIPSTGEARIERESPIDVIEGPRALAAMQKAEALKFMEEPVTVMLHETTNVNEANPVELGVNGRMIVLWRGFPYIIKRKYLERLARAKTTRVQQEAVTENGIRGYRYHPKTAPTYPFVVNEDQNPLGRDWLRKVLAEA